MINSHDILMLRTETQEAPQGKQVQICVTLLHNLITRYSKIVNNVYLVCAHNKHFFLFHYYLERSLETCGKLVSRSDCLPIHLYFISIWRPCIGVRHYVTPISAR